MTLPLPAYPPPIRNKDISGNDFPPLSLTGGRDISSILSVRPAYIEAPANSTQFLVAFSTTVASGVRVALFTLDASSNIVFPSAAILLPDTVECRVSAVAIGGDSPAGAPTLFFSLANKDGSKRYNGFENVPLPGRGGIYAVGFEPIMWIRDRNAFIGGWVENQGASARYVEMFIQGWYWSV